MIKVDANLFRLVYTAVSTEETRYYLNGVHIEPHSDGGAILVSTDGQRMIVAHDPDGECSESVIVRLPQFVRAQCKTPRFFGGSRILEINPTDTGSATLKEITPGRKEEDEPKIETLLTAYGVIIDGTFPDWRRVIPSKPDAAAKAGFIGFNDRYLKDWGAFSVDLQKTVNGASSGMQLFCADAASPTLIRWGGVPNIFAVLMPMRIDAHGFLPDFMSKTEFREAAE